MLLSIRGDVGRGALVSSTPKTKHDRPLKPHQPRVYDTGIKNVFALIGRPTVSVSSYGRELVRAMRAWRYVRAWRVSSVGIFGRVCATLPPPVRGARARRAGGGSQSGPQTRLSQPRTGMAPDPR